MILKKVCLSLWVVLSVLICMTASEESEAVSPGDISSISTTSAAPSTVSNPTTHTPLQITSLPEALLARANVSPSSPTIKSIPRTGSSATTSKPDKRQISLGEFQRLVAKVNDEIALLRSQSANLSQTYEVLLQRYNERSSQIPIILYEAANACSNGTTASLEDTTVPAVLQDNVTSTTDVEEEDNVGELTETIAPLEDVTKTEPPAITSSAGTPIWDPQMVAISTPVTPASTLDELRHTSTFEAPSPTPANSQTHIYGNSYYNYIHYYMYPASEREPDKTRDHVIMGQRKKNGTVSVVAVPAKFSSSSKPSRNEWDSQAEAWEAPFLDRDLVVYNRRFPATANGKLPLQEHDSSEEENVNLRIGLTESRPSYGLLHQNDKKYADANTLKTYSQRNPNENDDTKATAQKHADIGERNHQQDLPIQKFFSTLPGIRTKPTIDGASKASFLPDKITAFLEKHVVPPKTAETPPVQTATVVTAPKRVMPSPSENPNLQALKPSRYLFPNVGKPASETNWGHGHEFSFIEKLMEAKKQQENRRISAESPWNYTYK